MRGLAVFISDIRNCKSKEAELKRINKELANIRSKFNSDKALDGYQKKKYVCKLLFIFLLGHEIDFGHMEAVNLLSSNKYTEKQIGYLFISVLINTNSDLIKLIVQNIKNDLMSSNPIHVNLALQCIANIGSREMVESFGADVSRMLVSPDAIDSVKQSAALCLLRLFRTSPDVIPGGDWTSRVIHLLNDQHMGVVTSAVSLIEALVEQDPDKYRGCIGLAVSRLSRIVTANYQDLQDYTYYFVPAPWLSVKLLRLLQNYPPPDEGSVKARLNQCLETVLKKADEPPKSKKVQHSNAKNAVLMESISVVINSDSESDNLVGACYQLGQFLTHRETNLRYLALESLCLLAASDLSQKSVRKHQERVIYALKTERDVSVRQRAVDLLYAMCDRTNAETIVQEMLDYLESADYSIREEMVLKVAILSEKYAVDYSWYVDVILNLIRIAGDYVSEEVWFRVIQIVVNREDVQGYAAKTVFEALQAPACHENMVKVGGYILGEFGNLIAGDSRSAPAVQFQLLHSKYHLCSATTRALLLTTFVKFINLFPEIKPQVQKVFCADSNMRSDDAELQQRACEYHNLSEGVSVDVLATVLEEMPPFPERESSILATLKKKSGRIQDTVKPTRPVIAAKTSPSPKPVPKEPVVTSSTGLLVDVLEDSVAPITADGSNGLAQLDSNPADQLENAYKLALKNNGILLENDILQIGLKGEFRQNLGRISVFYGNKTSSPLQGFRAVVSTPGMMSAMLMVQAMPVDSVIEAGAQVQQLINVERIGDFAGMPDFCVSFSLGGVMKTFNLKLPVTLNKFFEASEMTSSVFFSRWKNLNGPKQECQRIFKARTTVDNSAVRSRLSGFGMALLNSVDPNPNNFVCAGILHGRGQQIGCLLRLEPNEQAQMYRLTIRSSKDDTSSFLCDLLENQF